MIHCPLRAANPPNPGTCGYLDRDANCQNRDRQILALLALVCSLVGCATASRFSCVGSYERGIRGEVMKTADGRTLYFNGQCWTRQPIPPTDLALERPTPF